jgi:protein phosphatase-4 regulatory subunit 3
LEDPVIRTKIHYTYRLGYLKDVVLARILDDPTYSVLNSLIFYHQVDIVNHIGANSSFLKELFSLLGGKQTDEKKRKDAIMFIQQCCAIGKSIQANQRNALYTTLVSHGLFEVIQFALKHQDSAVRVAGADILVALIDHDAFMVRSCVFKSLQERRKPLTDTFIELFLVEVDLGVKSQMADAIKILLDPSAISASVETLSRTNPDFMAKLRSSIPSFQSENFFQKYYEDSVRKLFQPLKDLEERERGMLTWPHRDALANPV